MIEHQRHPWRVKSAAAVLILIVTIVVASVVGCAFVLPDSIDWPCPTRPIERLRDTETRIECPATGRVIVIKHPKAATP